MAAAKAAVDRFVPTSAEQETEDGAVIYDIEGTADGKRFEIEVSAAGRVLDIESGPDDDDEDDGDGDDEEEELQGDD